MYLEVHFGSKNGNTYIDHGDKTKRSNYIKRHQVNEDFDNPYSPGALSRWLLWGDSTDLYKNLKEFRKKSDKPLLKGAYIEEAVYLGDDQLDNLVNIKSKEELLGEIIGLLQSPAKNVISALQSGGQTLSGIVKTLSER